jgi:D-beta-D-heptose 7-phosphate kinase/D-beta-D-heptose 1-phosphate adenosyltransferase
MKKIIVNGSFDILHVGHLRLLEYARCHRDSYVYVLIDSDRRIAQLKGKHRPVNNEFERSSFLFALKAVDRVDIFDSDAELDTLIKNFEPDLMIKGSDYRGRHIIGAEHCKEVIFYDRLDLYSTTKKVQDIYNAVLATK